MHPEMAYRLTPAAIIELKEDRDVYLVTPDMANELPGEFTAAALYTTITRQGVLHLWPVKLPNPDGRHNDWHRSAAEAAELAMRKWMRITANMSLGAYEIFEGRVDGFDQDEAESERDERAVILRRLLASKCDTLEAFELADRLFDARPCLVECFRKEGGHILGAQQKAAELIQDVIKAEQRTKLKLITAPVDGVVQ